MPMFKLTLLMFTCLMLPAVVHASESDELREKAAELQRKTMELTEQGQHQEAAVLKRNAMAMVEEANRLERDHLDRRRAEINEREQLLKKLHQKERELRDSNNSGESLAQVRREAERVKDELLELTRSPRPGHAGPQPENARRLEHMRAAVMHLHQAGLHELANAVVQRVDETEREFHEQAMHHPGDEMHNVVRQLDELRHEVERLRELVNESKTAR